MRQDFFAAVARLAVERSRLLTKEAALWNEFSELLTATSSWAETAPTPPTKTAAPAGDSRSDRLLRVQHAADLLGLSAGTLNKWRVTGGGPEFVKMGRSILYRRDALERFISSKVKPHTSAYDPPPARTRRR